jgi:hypothetical protein
VLDCQRAPCGQPRWANVDRSVRCHEVDRHDSCRFRCQGSSRKETAAFARIELKRGLVGWGAAADGRHCWLRARPRAGVGFYNTGTQSAPMSGGQTNARSNNEDTLTACPTRRSLTSVRPFPLSRGREFNQRSVLPCPLQHSEAQHAPWLWKRRASQGHQNMTAKNIRRDARTHHRSLPLWSWTRQLPERSCRGCDAPSPKRIASAAGVQCAREAHAPRRQFSSSLGSPTMRGDATCFVKKRPNNLAARQVERSLDVVFTMSCHRQSIAEHRSQCVRTAIFEAQARPRHAVLQTVVQSEIK